MAVAVSIYKEMQKMREGEMKIIKVDKCWSCPWYKPHRWQCYEDYDRRENRYITDPYITPFWCPLEDAREETDADM